MIMTDLKPIMIESNFIYDSDCDEIIKAFQNYQGSDIRRFPQRTEAPAYSIPECNVLQRTIVAVRYAVSDYSGLKLDIEFPLLSEMREGDSHALHADAEKLVDGQWVPNHTPERIWTALVYLNTGDGVDFDGGEIIFPEFDCTIVPKAGLLVASPTTHEYIHEVPIVTNGVRYALPIWLKRLAE